MLVTLNRPNVLNAAHEAMHSELAGPSGRTSSYDDETRVAVVTGAGRAFSAGGDLGMVERQIGNYDLVTSMLREMSDLVYNMANCEKPIVSAINGVAVGAGLVVALLADISICASDARLGDGHVRLGVAAGDHAAIIWPLLCGLAKAKYYLLTGEMVTGAEAERIGLVSKALPADEVLPEALRVANQLASGPQLAIRLTKRALNGWVRDAGAIFDQSAAYEMLTFMGEDIKEGLASLREKRAPQFGWSAYRCVRPSIRSRMQDPPGRCAPSTPRRRASAPSAATLRPSARSRRWPPTAGRDVARPGPCSRDQSSRSRCARRGSRSSNAASGRTGGRVVPGNVLPAQRMRGSTGVRPRRPSDAGRCRAKTS